MSRHRRGYRGPRYHPRKRRQTQAPVQHAASAPGLSISQSRRERHQQALAAEAVRATRERLDRESAEEVRLIARTANDPMTSEPTWHVHEANAKGAAR